MRHAGAIGIKLIIVGTVILSIFGIFYNTSVMKLITMSVIVTGVSYAIGDVFLLRKFGNVVASISDLIIHFLTIWTLTGIFIGAGTPLIIASLGAAYLITATEPIFHAYMIERVFQDEEDERVIFPAEIQTEFAEEIDPEVEKTKNISENKQTDQDEHGEMKS